MSFVTVQQTKAALKLLSKNTAERLKVMRKGDIVCYALIIFALFFFSTWNLGFGMWNYQVISEHN